MTAVPAKTRPASPPAAAFSPYAALALLILLLAAALRLHNLGTQSLWHDEGNSLVQATRSLSAIADNAARDIHPPAYYWLLAIWQRLLGQSELGLRALSAFASLLTVALTFTLGRRLFHPIVGLVAMTLVALNTFNIYYAQEARMYALLAMWAAAAMLALVLLLQALAQDSPTKPGWHDPITRRVIALGLLNAAGLYTQYAFPFVMLAQGLVFLLWLGTSLRVGLGLRWRALRAYVMANLLALLVFAPWAPTAIRQVTEWPNTGEQIPSGEALATIAAYFGFGITLGSGTTITVIFFALFGLLQFAPSAGESRDQHLRRVWTALLPVLWVAVSVGLFVLLDLFREANLKLLLPAQIGFALWLARGAALMWALPVRDDSASWKPLVPKLAAAVGMLTYVLQIAGGIAPLYDDPAYQRDDYRAIAHLIQQDARPGDAILLSAPNQQEVFDYYYAGQTPVYALPRGLGGDDAATLREVRDIIDTHSHIYAVLWATGERDPNGIVENTLDAEAYEAASTWYGDVRLVRYATPAEFESVQALEARFGGAITLESFALSSDSLRRGDILQIQLRWRTDEALPMNYKVFIQLLSAEGLVEAQRDAEPGGGLYPTSAWQPGTTIIDQHALIVPNDLPASHYSLILGLYNPDNPLERLPVADGDYLTLAEFEID